MCMLKKAISTHFKDLFWPGSFQVIRYCTLNTYLVGDPLRDYIKIEGFIASKGQKLQSQKQSLDSLISYYDKKMCTETFSTECVQYTHVLYSYICEHMYYET